MTLEGLKVLDLTRLLPGGYCTLLLADMGADVLKVEDPFGGDYVRWFPPKVKEESAYFLAVNRNKKSMKLNLKHDRGKQLLKELARRYDVLVEGFRPGVMEKLGLGYDDVSKINPRIVYCSISGYGQDGPYSQRAGHDINYIGIAGILGITGFKDRPPVVPGVPIADFGGGGMLAALGIMMALYSRDRTGKGQYVDISMMDGVASWMANVAARWFTVNDAQNRGDVDLAGGLICYSTYETKDGRYLSVGALEPKFWANFCRLIGREDLIDVQLDVQHDGRLKEEITKIFKGRTMDEWLSLLRDHDTCIERVNTVAEAMNDPQMRHREMVVEIDHPTEGRIKAMGIPIKMSDTPGRVDRLPAPAYGEHTHEVLTELGLTRAEIEMLAAEKVI
ncbi:MAG: CoA transferase [Candidatus Abyssobacteria bacterium SURF_17]|uniref:CoA transferase n=1 Tax=Candidatus Abyssobacteria bacterium SURF_17 TaxID=2093361 RepID=A0A419ETL7_9BACT|nr:MAG: CoA transferase [Candidatus Abyssubacteria bacterium SURF_17]